MEVEVIIDEQEQKKLFAEYERLRANDRRGIAGEPTAEVQEHPTTISGKPAKAGFPEAIRIVRGGRAARVYKGSRSKLTLIDTARHQFWRYRHWLR